MWTPEGLPLMVISVSRLLCLLILSICRPQKFKDGMKLFLNPFHTHFALATLAYLPFLDSSNLCFYCSISPEGSSPHIHEAHFFTSFKSFARWHLHGEILRTSLPPLFQVRRFRPVRLSSLSSWQYHYMPLAHTLICLLPVLFAGM